MTPVMLKDMMENPDINGNTFTRQRLRSNADNFKLDERVRAKDFEFQHHHVVEMIDGSYLVCVTDPATGSVLLYSAGPNKEPYTISDCHPLEFTAMRLEAQRQLELHTGLENTPKPAKRVRTKATKKEVVKND